MNLTKTGWCFAIAITAIVAVLALTATSHRRDVRLAHGSRLVLEKVIYGKPVTLQLGGFIERVKGLLPQALVNRFFKGKKSANISYWSTSAMVHTNDDALYVYFTRRGATNGSYMNVDLRNAAVVDAHGCELYATQAGGEDNGVLRTSGTPPGGGRPGYSVGWFRFEAFPRHERNFRLRVYADNGRVEAEFLVPNPAPIPATNLNWAIEPLPITQSNAALSFSLLSVTIKTNSGTGPGNSPRIAPQYEVQEGGQPSTNWQVLDPELYDSSGNFASEMYGDVTFLCPEESAWKLRVKFYGNDQSRSASNALWTVRGLAVPAPGEFTSLSGSMELLGVELQPAVFAGVGEFEYSNSVPVSGSPLTGKLEQSTMQTSYLQSSLVKNSHLHSLKSRTPHLALNVTGLTDDQRMSARATDDQGRVFYGYELHQYSSTRRPKGKVSDFRYLDRRSRTETVFLAFELAPDSKIVDVTFCVHGCYKTEFIFQPPSH